MSATTVPAALAQALRGDVAAPFVTWIGAGGLRSELSLRTFENNLAKTANLLRDDADAGPGTVVALHLPLHWQSAVWLGACALVGAAAAIGGDPAAADVGVVGPDSLGLPAAPLALATALHPLGMPFAPGTALPDGVLDAAVEVRAHGDRFTAYDDVEDGTTWIEVSGRTLTQSEALEDAARLAASLDLPEGGRLLVAGTRVDERAALALGAVPLIVRGSVVLLADGSSPAQAAAAERCDAVLELA
jgi:uncharacterized protein (TIGR03089 family)